MVPTSWPCGLGPPPHGLCAAVMPTHRPLPGRNWPQTRMTSCRVEVMIWGSFPASHPGMLYPPGGEEWPPPLCPGSHPAPPRGSFHPGGRQQAGQVPSTFVTAIHKLWSHVVRRSRWPPPSMGAELRTASGWKGKRTRGRKAGSRGGPSHPTALSCFPSWDFPERQSVHQGGNTQADLRLCGTRMSCTCRCACVCKHVCVGASLRASAPNPGQEPAPRIPEALSSSPYPGAQTTHRL